MQALIDNYTTFNQNVSGSAYTTVQEIPKGNRPVASIVFPTDVNFLPNLNEREILLLQEYKLLKNNWDGDDAKAPGEFPIKIAEFLIKSLQSAGQKVFHVAPGPNGEILVDLRNNSKSIELLFYEAKSKFVLFSDKEEPQQGPFELNMLPKLLKWLNA
jgi:hypothetical protein